MKIKIVVITLFLSCVALNAQNPSVSWQNLNDVSWKRGFVKALNDYYDMPIFGREIEKLNNTEISIKGFYVPVDTKGKIFALSKSPSNMCFFCGTGGIETVMEIFVKNDHKELKRIKTDKYIEVKGIFVLNRDDPNHLMYLLKDAELVRIIK